MKKPVRILLVIVLCLVLIAFVAHKFIPFNAYRYDDASRYTAGDGEISQQVEVIDISWISGNVTIEQHDGDEIILTETSNRKLNKKERVHWLVDGDTLYVKYARSGRNSFSRLEKELTLLLPDNLQLDDILISTVSADIDADLPQTKDLTVQSVSSNASITLQQTETVSYDTVSGDALLRFASAPSSINADAVSADMTVQLPGNAGFKAEIDSVSGRLTGDLLDGSGDMKSYTSGNGECVIRMESVSGDLTLEAYTR